ncbi:MAG: helix-turn-helix domain-containing protein [Armatimonadota bacterium]
MKLSLDQGERLSRRERRKEETRQRIIAAALELMQEKPFDQITVEEIAERADVAKGTFFLYFPTKEQLLHAYMEELTEDVYEFLEQLQPETAESQWEVLRRVMLYIASRDGMSLALTRSIMVACCQSTELRRRMMELVQEATQHALTGFICGQQRGEFRRDVSPETLAHYAVRLYRLCLMEWMMEKEDAPLTELVERTLAFFKPAFVAQEVNR